MFSLETRRRGEAWSPEAPNLMELYVEVGLNDTRDVIWVMWLRRDGVSVLALAPQNGVMTLSNGIFTHALVKFDIEIHKKYILDMDFIVVF